MTPIAIIVFGAAAFFLYRLRFALLSLGFDLYNGIGMARALREKEARRQQRPRNRVRFFTVEQVWPEEEGEEDEEDERESA